MNNKEFIAELAHRSGYKQNDTRRLVQSFIDALGECLEEGESVYLAGLGTFDVKKRLEKTLVNPVTGKLMLVPPKLVMNFRPSASIKDKLKNGENSHEENK